MSTAKHFFLGAIVISIVTVACGPLESDVVVTPELDAATSWKEATYPESWGSCPPGVFYEFVPLDAGLTLVDTWVEISNGDAAAQLASDSGSEPALSLVAALVRSGRLDRPEVSIHSAAESSTRQAVSAGADLLIETDGDTPTQLVIGLFDNGGVVFLGECRRGFTEHWRLYAGETGLVSPADQLRNAVDVSSDEYAHFASWAESKRVVATPVRWEDRSPWARTLDVTEAPADVFENLTYLPVLIDLPTSWAVVAGEVCPRISIAWGEACVPAEAEQPMLLPMYVDVNEPLEIWLVNQTVSPPETTVMLVGIQPTDLTNAAIVEDAVLHLTTTFNPQDTADVIAQAASAGLLDVSIITINEALDMLPEARPSEDGGP